MYPIPTVRIPVTVAMAIVEFLIYIRKNYLLFSFFFFFPKKVVARVSDEVESHEASMSFAWTLALIKMEK